MAGLVAWIPFNSAELNFSGLAGYADLFKPELRLGYNLSDGSKVYPDAFFYYWLLDDNNFGVSAFVGRDFTPSDGNDILSGRVEAYIEISLSIETGEATDRFVISGLDASLADVKMAIKTSDVKDDYEIFAKSFEKKGVFIGSLFDDALSGFNGDDFFVPGPGNDLIDGGNGKNSIFYAGNVSEYQILNAEKRIFVTDKVVGRDGNDELLNIHKIDFNDVSIFIGRNGRSDSVYKLYKAALGRMPDSDGFAFWSETESPANLSESPNSASSKLGILAWSDYSEVFGSNWSAQGIISDFYKIILGRTPDSEGKKFWTDQFYQGTSAEAIYNGFVNSPEYRDGIWLADQILNSSEAILLNGLNNTEYIQKIAENLLGESALFPSSGEWVDLLNLGTSRSVALLGVTFFTDSQSSLVPDIAYGYMVT